MCNTDEQFLTGIPGFYQNGKKTLEWPTILDGFDKLDGFDNPGFIPRVRIPRMYLPRFVNF